MSKSGILDRSLKSLSKISPHYFARGQMIAMQAAPEAFVREALWRIAHPSGRLIDRDVRVNREDVMQFLAFAAPLVPRSSSQFSQDLWALWEAGGKRGGYFVEFGATDGKFLSNSFFLEKEMGWTGVVAEPHPEFSASLKANRSCFISTKCVYSHSGEHADFFAFDNRGSTGSHLASIKPSDSRSGTSHEVIKVETISLNDLLVEARAPTDIDFLSIDTEGSEIEILSHFDFNKWDVRCIVVEHNHTARRQALFDLLTSRGFRRKWPDIGHVDDWYTRV